MSKQTTGSTPLFATIASFILVAGSFAPVALGDITIDEYTAGSTIARFTAGTSNQITLSGSILGGQRNDSLTLRDLSGDEFFGILGFNGNAQIGQGTADRVYGSMLYNNFADIDLTAGSTNYAFSLEVDGVDSALPLSNVFSITVNDGVNSSTVGFDLPGSVDVPAEVLIRFDQFAGVDFSSIDSISLAFDFLGAPGQDVSIAGFHAVPEPSQATLLLIGVVAWMGRRRRA